MFEFAQRTQSSLVYYVDTVDFVVNGGLAMLNKPPSQCTWWMTALLLLSLAGSLASVVREPSPSPQSPAVAMFRSNPAHSGVYGDSTSGIYGGVQWYRQTAGPIRSSPVVVGDKVLVGSSDGHLYALDANSGNEKWAFDAKAAVESTPAVADGRVFFSSANSAFYALNLDDGKLLWMAHFGPDAAVAYQQDTGTHVATYRGEFILSSPTVVADTVVVGGGDGAVYAFDTASGHPRWKYQTAGRVRSSPAISNGVAFAASFDGTVYAIDLNSGKLVWRYDTEGKSLSATEFGFDRKSILSSPAVSAGVVYIGSRDSHLYALDAATGSLKWKHDFADSTWSVSSPAVASGTVYTGTADGHSVEALDTEDGHEVWQFTMPSRVWSSPAVAGNELYVTNQSGSLFALDRASGSERWHFQTKSSLESSPSVSKGVVYFGADDGTVYAIRADAPQSIRRAVYFDDATTKLWASLGFSVKVSDQLAFRDFFSARGYDLLDASAISDWLEQRISDRAPSVLALATPGLPDSVTGSDPARSSFRRYLDAGGKIVWIGYHPPLMMQLVFDKNHAVAGVDIKHDDARSLVGVSYDGALQDDINYNRVTPVGRQWGLPEWWLGTWDVRPSPEIKPLSLDDRGYAGSWVRSYGGSPGTGFVYIGLDSWNIEMLNHLALVAEYRPR